jgi:hypothetical protein
MGKTSARCDQSLSIGDVPEQILQVSRQGLNGNNGLPQSECVTAVVTDIGSRVYQHIHFLKQLSHKFGLDAFKVSLCHLSVAG